MTTVSAGTRKGSEVSGSAVEALKASLRGELVRPGDPAYETARRVHNAMIDRHPSFIVYCVDVADVISCVNFARENSLTLSVRGGGHNVAGFSVCDDGIVIDLSKMKGVRVDPGNRRVTAQGGCTLGDMDHATHAFGLAAPGGVVSTTGIAGLTLGGGIGHLTRKYGLSCDNLMSADVVTADGRFLTASAEENADLFWGLRGGGGNFGVVTSFEFRAHPVSTVFAGPILWHVDKAPEVLKFYREFIRNAPEDLNVILAFMVVRPGPPFPEHLHNKHMLGAVPCYAGPLDKGEKVTQPLREFGPPAFEHVGPMPFPVLQSIFDPVALPGLYCRREFGHRGMLKYRP